MDNYTILKTFSVNGKTVHQIFVPNITGTEKPKNDIRYIVNNTVMTSEQFHNKYTKTK